MVKKIIHQLIGRQAILAKLTREPVLPNSLGMCKTAGFKLYPQSNHESNHGMEKHTHLYEEKISDLETSIIAIDWEKYWN